MWKTKENGCGPIGNHLSTGQLNENKEEDLLSTVYNPSRLTSNVLSSTRLYEITCVRSI